jgi:WD40 repeat protein
MVNEFNVRFDAQISPSGKYYAVKDYQLARILVFETSTHKKINELWGHADPTCNYSSVGIKNCKGTEEFVFLNDDTIVTTGADQSIRYWKVQ